MENIYSTKTKDYQVKAKEETIRFLLDYSKSLHIINTGPIAFENNIN